MFYGLYSLQTQHLNDAILDRLRSVIFWKESIENQVVYGNFSGGFFSDPRLPYTPEEYVFLDIHQDILVILSGCIYNRKEICEEHNFNPAAFTDPALIAQLFLENGVHFVQKLNGDFTIFIYQTRDERLYLFRDHLGIRPLAYTIEGKSLYFSSDIIGLCRTFNHSGSIDVEYLLSDFKFSDFKQTPNKRVLKLYPGHFLKFDSNGVHTEKYWKPERINTDYTLTQSQVLSEVKSLLSDAVRIRSDQRFSAGAHVSGGLDSGTVAALARKEYASQPCFYGYSWSPADYFNENIEFDEREYVQSTCDWADIIPVYVPFSYEDFSHSSKNILKNQKAFHEDKILKLIQSQKVNLVFSGWGGDEFISRSGHGIDWDLFFSFEWNHFFKRNPLTNPKNLLGRIVFKFIYPLFHILKSYQKQDLRERVRYLKKPFDQHNQEALKTWFFTPSGRGSCLRMLYNYHLSGRTEFWFVNGISQGVEYRYPLLDKRIVEYMLKVPTKFRIDGEYSRFVLREITKGLLPEEVRLRRSKIDPVSFALIDQNYAKAGEYFSEDMSSFKSNPHLQCIDFELIQNDLNLYEERGDKEALKALYMNIYSIKLMHEFTKCYFD